MKSKIVIIIILILLKSSEVFSVISSGGNISTMLKNILTISGKTISSDGSITVIHYGGSINLGGGQISGGDYEAIGSVGGGGGFISNVGPASDLTNVKVYPNPYKPGTNSIYDNSLLGEGVVFTNLTAKAKVKIYNITGEFITEFEETNADGLYLWNTKNSDGEEVESGVYIFFVINPDNKEQTTKGKFVIIR